MVKRADLEHIPGDYGLPIFGHTLRMLRNAEKWALDGLDRYGPVSRGHVLFEPWVVVAVPDLAKSILLDRDQVFSSKHGWRTSIGKLFDRGLMLRDFDDHRFHRRVMQEAFRSEAMKGYVDAMNPIVADRLRTWETGATRPLYREFKQLTLDIATKVFVGIPLGPEADRVNRAFIRMVTAGFSPIRREVPGSAFRRGMGARRFLQEWFGSRISERRGRGLTDLFSRLCDAQDEEGGRFQDDEIVDHMIFLLMAAHDTTTSTLATMAWELARNPGWQERLRQEVDGLPGPHLAWDDRKSLPQVDWVFKEAMRLHPPVPFIPRRTVTEVEIGGYPVPAQTPISVSSLLIHRLPEFWTNPHAFDPERFSPERREDQGHSHCYFPFSGGAHTCIGMHFAGLMTQAIMVQLLSTFRLESLPNQDVFIQTLPIPKPRGGLPLRVETVGG
jgi:cytochrome P450